jgi:tRNA nucleotidyltransferase (CCA-adding enzyme)
MSPLDTLPAELREACAQVADAVTAAGGRALLVGGVVRDWLLGLPGKDVDIEVFGLPAAELRRVLRQRFPVVEVGSSFGVFKLRGLEVDIALPRRESKTGRGHKGFAVEGDPGMTVAEASARRDFTINSIYWDIARGGLLDPHGGREDLVAAVLRHTGPQFAEDPLACCAACSSSPLWAARRPRHRRRLPRHDDRGPSARAPLREWRKLILKGRDMSAGSTSCVKRAGCPTSRNSRPWSAARRIRSAPEGDVWNPTLHAMDAFATLRTGDDAEISSLAWPCFATTWANR